MLHRTPALLIIVPFTLLTLLLAPAPAATIYVNDDAPGANTGSSWTDAYTSLQSALDTA